MYEFSNEPKKVSQKYYENARNEIIQYYSKDENITSIYEYGSVSAPGVSDLDIILVLKNKLNVPEHFFDFSTISDQVHGLVADGNVMKMSEDIFSRINYLDRLYVKKLFGKELLLKLPNKNDQETLELISVVDWLPERILRLTSVINSKKINITNVLCILHSFSYSIHKINVLIKGVGNFSNVLNTITLLRNSWHEVENPKEKLIECIFNSISLGYSYLAKFEGHLKHVGGYPTPAFQCSENITLELYNKHFIQFVEVGFDSNLESQARDLSSDSETFVVVSNFYYPHFYILSNQNGLLSNVMKSKIKPYYEASESLLNCDYVTNLVRKMEVAESNAQYLLNNNMKKGLIRYGFHFHN
jgi:hypothetical protein